MALYADCSLSYKFFSRNWKVRCASDGGGAPGRIGLARRKASRSAGDRCAHGPLIRRFRSATVQGGARALADGDLSKNSIFLQSLNKCFYIKNWNKRRMGGTEGRRHWQTGRCARHPVQFAGRWAPLFVDRLHQSQVRQSAGGLSQSDQKRDQKWIRRWSNSRPICCSRSGR